MATGFCLGYLGIANPVNANNSSLIFSSLSVPLHLPSIFMIYETTVSSGSQPQTTLIPHSTTVWTLKKKFTIFQGESGPANKGSLHYTTIKNLKFLSGFCF